MKAHSTRAHQWFPEQTRSPQYIGKPFRKDWLKKISRKTFSLHATVTQNMEISLGLKKATLKHARILSADGNFLFFFGRKIHQIFFSHAKNSFRVKIDRIENKFSHFSPTRRSERNSKCRCRSTAEPSRALWWRERRPRREYHLRTLPCIINIRTNVEIISQLFGFFLSSSWLCSLVLYTTRERKMFFLLLFRLN